MAFAVSMVANLAAGIYLVMTAHYGWAWIPFLIAASLSVKTSAKDDE